jgi:tetratricopeptide (TPR) repeat protein
LKAVLLAATLCLAWPAVHALDLCDTAGKQKEFYRSSIKPLENLLYEKKLGQLDHALNEMLAAHAAGKMSDVLVHRAFERYDSSYASWEPLLREWVAKYPKSQAARLALGYHLTRRGWGARGGKYSNETSGRQFAEMEKYFREALKVYDEADALGKRPTLSIAQRIWMSRSMRGLGLDAQKLYRDAIKAYPDTLQVRIRYLEMSEPKWGGSIEDMESVIGDAKSLSPADQRYLQYLAYQEIATVYQCDELEACGGRQRVGANARQVVAYYEKSIASCPALDESLEMLIKYQFDAKNYRAVIDTATRAIRRNPRLVQAFANRGYAYGNTGRHKEAFADLERAALLGEDYAFKDLAWMYETGTGVAKDLPRAIDLYMIADMRKVDGARKEAERLSKATGIPLK